MKAILKIVAFAEVLFTVCTSQQLLAIKYMYVLHCKLTTSSCKFVEDV